MLTHVITSPYAGDDNALECGEATAVRSSASIYLFQIVRSLAI